MFSDIGFLHLQMKEKLHYLLQSRVKRCECDDDVTGSEAMSALGFSTLLLKCLMKRLARSALE